MLTFALELSRRLAKRNVAIKVVPVHPGVAATGITRGGDRMNPIIRDITKTIFGIIGQSAKQGACPILYAATAPHVKNGDYYGPGGAGERKGLPAPAKIAPQAKSHQNGETLWQLTEALLGETYRI